MMASPSSSGDRRLAEQCTAETLERRLSAVLGRLQAGEGRGGVAAKAEAETFGAKLEAMEEELRAVEEATGELARRMRRQERTLRNVEKTKKMVRSLGRAKEEARRLEEASESGDWRRAAASVGFFREMETDKSAELLDESLRAKTRRLEQEVVRRVKKEFEKALALAGSAVAGELGELVALMKGLGLEEEARQRYASFARHKFAEKCEAIVRASGTSGSGGGEGEKVTQMFLAVADAVEGQCGEGEGGREQQQRQQQQVVVRELEAEAERQTAGVVRQLGEGLTGGAGRQTAQLDAKLEEAAMVFQRVGQFRQYMEKLGAGGETGGTGATGGVLQQAMQELTDKYVSAERKFLVEAVAGAAGTADEGFFVAQKAARRAIRTRDANVACAVANHVVDVLSEELRGLLESRASEAKIEFASFCGNPKQVLQKLEGEGEGEDEGATMQFVHAVDDVAQSAENCESLKRGLEEEFNEQFATSEGGNFRQMYGHCVLGLEVLKKELDDMHANLSKLLLHFFKGAFLSPALMNLEKLNYDLASEAEFRDLQINDPFVRQFLAGATVTLNFVKKFCLPRTSEAVLFILIDQLTSRLEKLLLASDCRLRFSAFGALQFDNEVRSIVNFFTAQTEHSVRAKFAKLTDIACLLNLESVDEFVALYGGRGKLRLTVEEIKAVLLLRLDFNRATIEQIFS